MICRKTHRLRLLVDERLDALTLAIKSFAEAHEVIVEDLANVEAILHNLERAFGEAFEGRDVSSHVARITSSR